MNIRTFRGQTPRIHGSAFVDPSVIVIGDVEVGEDSSIWPGCVVRGDVESIRIGRRTNLQDLTLVHVTSNKHPTSIGDDVTVGHRVILHGCTVKDRVLVGMGAILMDGVVVGEDCIVGAGALLSPGTQVPPGSLILGSPGRVKRPISAEERAFLRESAARYVGYASEHREALRLP